MSKPNITQEIACATLQYDPQTGHFTWRERSDQWGRKNTRQAGKLAGHTAWRGSQEYRIISLLNYPILAHRLAFIYMLGVVPDLIDHADGNGLNNAWSNLRVTTKSLNGANANRSKKNTSGYKGVSFHLKSGKWRATITANRKHISLGYYNTAEQAHAAYIEKAKELFGDFARVK